MNLELCFGQDSHVCNAREDEVKFDNGKGNEPLRILDGWMKVIFDCEPNRCLNITNRTNVNTADWDTALLAGHS